MATLTVQAIDEDGLNATYSAAASGGDDFANSPSGRIFLHVKNGDASSHTVTVAAQDNTLTIPGIGSVTKADASVAIPAGEERFLGPFPYGAFGSAPAITYDAVTSVTIAAIKV